MGTRNSRAPSGEELRRTGVSTSVKPMILALQRFHAWQSHTLVMQMTTDDVGNFAPRLEIVGKFRTT